MKCTGNEPQQVLGAEVGEVGAGGGLGVEEQECMDWYKLSWKTLIISPPVSHLSKVNWTVQTVKPRLLPTFRPLVLLSYYHGMKTCYISKTKLLDFPEAAGEWGGGVAWPGTLHRCRSNSRELGWWSVLFCRTEAVEAQEPWAGCLTTLISSGIKSRDWNSAAQKAPLKWWDHGVHSVMSWKTSRPPCWISPWILWMILTSIGFLS